MPELGFEIASSLSQITVRMPYREKYTLDLSLARDIGTSIAMPHLSLKHSTEKYDIASATLLLTRPGAVFRELDGKFDSYYLPTIVEQLRFALLHDQISQALSNPVVT